MKKIKRILFLLTAVSCFLLALSACGGNDDEGKLDNPEPSKVLVAYFSRTNNTERVAGYIAEATGGTLYEIVPAEPYTDADIDYGNSSSRSAAENKDPSARPAVSGSVGNMASYEVIYLGYPIWYGNAPKIIYTFLESYDLSGKTVVPFCTSASSGLGSSAENLHALASGATWLSGKRFSSSAAKSDVEDWVSSLNGLR